MSLSEQLSQKISNHLNSYTFENIVEDLEKELDIDSDYEEFVVVDGEEGDYGFVKYFDKNKNLVAVIENHGGDDIYIKSVSPEFEKMIKLKLIEKILNMELPK